MIQKPKFLGPEHASVFSDRSVAEAYVHRPPYPDETYEVLRRLIVDEPRVLLELGCGLGEISRRLAPEVERVDAVDPSAAMLAKGRSLPGGDHPNLCWRHSSAEEFDYPATYALILAPESLGWLDWPRVFPMMRRALSPRGQLVALVRDYTAAWDADALDGIVPRYSTNRDFIHYDVVKELVAHGLFRVAERLTIQPTPVSQSIEDYIEFWHSRSGFSRERMGPEAASRFDDEARRLLTPHAVDGVLSYQLNVSLVSGAPLEA